MNPKSHKEFKKGIAEKIGVHQDVVDDFIAFYYDKVRKNLSELTYPSINIDNLGTFNIRKMKLEKAINKCKDILGNITKDTIYGFEKHIAIKKKLQLYETTMQVVEQIAKEKKEFKTKKYEKNTQNT